MLDQVMSMAGPSVTLTYAAVLGLIFVVLSFNVATKRGSMKISHGPGPNNEIEGAMRAQENFAEYVPLALILMAGLELTGADTTLLRWIGGLLVVVRLSHAIGLIAEPKLIIARAIGALGTLLIIAAESIWALVRVLS